MSIFIEKIVNTPEFILTMRKDRIKFRDEPGSSRRRKSPMKQLILWVLLLALVLLIFFFLG